MLFYRGNFSSAAAFASIPHIQVTNASCSVAELQRKTCYNTTRHGSPTQNVTLPALACNIPSIGAAMHSTLFINFLGVY
jgi:hypothetical protein